jgi:hypothetical protein
MFILKASLHLNIYKSSFSNISFRVFSSLRNKIPVTITIKITMIDLLANLQLDWLRNTMSGALIKKLW